MATEKIDSKKVYKIGIVDDHVQTVISLCSTLEFFGFKCLQAYNAEDALALAKKENPDLLLVDIVMNGKNGYELAKALPNKKIILMTAHERDDSKIAKLKNVAGLLEKPIGSKELLDMIRKVLGIPEGKQ